MLPPFMATKVLSENHNTVHLVAKIGKRSNGHPYRTPLEACGDNFY